MKINLHRKTYFFFVCFFILVAGCNMESVRGDSSSSVAQPTPIDRSVLLDIKPGVSIGPIALGDKFDTVLEVLPFKENIDEIHEASISLLRKDNEVIELKRPKEYRWQFFENDEFEGLSFFFFESDKVFQIESRRKRYRLNNGLGVGSKPEDVCKAFPQPEKFDFDYGQPRRPGYYFESYLVYQDKGLAFQVTSDHKGLNSEITMVIVFSPGRKFVPRGTNESLRYMKRK